MSTEPCSDAVSVAPAPALALHLHLHLLHLHLLHLHLTKVLLQRPSQKRMEALCIHVDQFLPSAI